MGIVLQQLSKSNQVKALSEKRIDISILAAPINSNKINISPIQNVFLKAVIPKKHSLACKQLI